MAPPFAQGQECHAAREKTSDEWTVRSGPVLGYNGSAEFPLSASSKLWRSGWRLKPRLQVALSRSRKARLRGLQRIPRWHPSPSYENRTSGISRRTLSLRLAHPGALFGGMCERSLVASRVATSSVVATCHAHPKDCPSHYRETPWMPCARRSASWASSSRPRARSTAALFVQAAV